jgi:hypothetical protein
VSGTAGGTGCGALIDFLYMLREIQWVANNNTLRINVLLAMPQGYVLSFKDNDTRYKGYQLNAYGLLTEINAIFKDRHGNAQYKTDGEGNHLDAEGNVTLDEDKFVELDNTWVGMQFSKHSVRPLPSGVVAKPFDAFNTAYMFDSFDGTAPLPFDTVSARIAEFMFYLEMGNNTQQVAQPQVTESLDSIFSNVLIRSRIDTALNPYIETFCSAATYTIQTHEELRRRYVREKFIYQMILHGFVGKDGDFPVKPDSDLEVEINNRIGDYCTQSWPTISELYQNSNKDDIYALLKNIETYSLRSTPNFAVIFSKLGMSSQIETNFDTLVDDLKSIVDSHCKKWIANYNVRHAYAKIREQDKLATLAYNKIISDISKKVPKVTWLSGLFKTTKKVFKDLEETFKYYIQVMALKALSESDQGYYDECANNLQKFIKKINIDEFEITTGRKLIEWDHWYIKDLSDLQNNQAKKFVPAINTLFAGTHLSATGCDFEKLYSALILQKGNRPELTYDTNNTPKKSSLLEYKQNILTNINLDYANFKDYFTPSHLGSQYGYGVWEIFLDATKKTAKELSEHISLASPFDLTTQATRDSIHEFLMDPNNKPFLSEKRNGKEHPMRAIFLGKFTGPGATLENEMRNDANLWRAGEMKIQNVSGQDDKYVKIVTQMNYDIDDYAYYQQYRRTFDAYYPVNFNAKNRHQPFSDFRYWKTDNADIVALYQKEAQEDQVQRVRQQKENERQQLLSSINWNPKEQYYAVCFMVILLNEYYERTKRLRNEEVKSYLNKLKKAKKGKDKVGPISFDRDSKTITLTYSPDFYFATNSVSYEATEIDTLKFVKLNQKKLDDFIFELHNSHSKFLKYWIDVISKIIDKIDDRTKLLIYANVYDIVYDLSGKDEVVNKIMIPYFNQTTRTTTNRDFIKEFRMFFNY